MLDEIECDVKEKTDEQEKNHREPLIQCKKCHFTITRSDFSSSPEGHHEHLQCNPQGFTFVFRCYYRAPGCLLMGTPTVEFSWFPGFYWQYAHCQGCGEHLGWYFRKPSNDSFFALITNKIIEKT